MSDLVGGKEVRFKSGELSLAGTLAVPASGGAVPAVLMLAGSGQTDRDDNAKALAIDLFPQFSAAIVRQGLATFRYDKRGVGGSEGDYFSSDFDDCLTDAVAAVEWLSARPEVDDLQVDPDDLDRMRDLVKSPFDALRPSGVTHLLRTEGTKRGLSGYKEQVRRPVDPRVISAVTDWLAAHRSG